MTFQFVVAVKWTKNSQQLTRTARNWMKRSLEVKHNFSFLWRYNLPGQVQHSLQDVAAVFGAGFTEQSVVCLLGEEKDH